jgi:hypothetical protein
VDDLIGSTVEAFDFEVIGKPKQIKPDHEVSGDKKKKAENDVSAENESRELEEFRKELDKLNEAELKELVAESGDQVLRAKSLDWSPTKIKNGLIKIFKKNNGRQ